MLDKDNIKDSTDIMFDNPLFSAAGMADVAGVVKEDGTTLSGAIMEKLRRVNPFKTPTETNCNSILGQISKASADLNNA